MSTRSRGEHDCSHRLWRPHPEAPEPAGAPAPDELAFEAEPPPALVEPYEPAFDLRVPDFLARTLRLGERAAAWDVSCW